MDTDSTQLVNVLLTTLVGAMLVFCLTCKQIRHRLRDGMIAYPHTYSAYRRRVLIEELLLLALYWAALIWIAGVNLS